MREIDQFLVLLKYSPASASFVLLESVLRAKWDQSYFASSLYFLLRAAATAKVVVVEVVEEEVIMEEAVEVAAAPSAPVNLRRRSRLLRVHRPAQLPQPQAPRPPFYAMA